MGKPFTVHATVTNLADIPHVFKVVVLPFNHALARQRRKEAALEAQEESKGLRADGSRLSTSWPPSHPHSHFSSLAAPPEFDPGSDVINNGVSGSQMRRSLSDPISVRPSRLSENATQLGHHQKLNSVVRGASVDGPGREERERPRENEGSDPSVRTAAEACATLNESRFGAEEADPALDPDEVFMDGALLCLEPAVSLGEVPPRESHSVALHFIALREGLLTLSNLFLLETNAHIYYRLQSLPQVFAVSPERLGDVTFVTAPLT